MLFLLKKKPRPSYELQSELEVSRATRTRLMRAARVWYGVQIKYDRKRDTFNVSSWGVVSPDGLDKWGRKRRIPCKRRKHQTEAN